MSRSGRGTGPRPLTERPLGRLPRRSCTSVGWAGRGEREGGRGASAQTPAGGAAGGGPSCRADRHRDLRRRPDVGRGAAAVVRGVRVSLRRPIRRRAAGLRSYPTARLRERILRRVRERRHAAYPDRAPVSPSPPGADRQVAVRCLRRRAGGRTRNGPWRARRSAPRSPHESRRRRTRSRCAHGSPGQPGSRLPWQAPAVGQDPVGAAEQVHGVVVLAGEGDAGGRASGTPGTAAACCKPALPVMPAIRFMPSTAA